MARQTSITVYDQIKAEGLLSKLETEVYGIVFQHGPCTSGEAFRHQQDNGSRRNPLSQSRARFTELRDKGVFQEVGEPRPCKVSGRTCIVWDVTDKLPVDPDKPDKPKLSKLEKKLTWDFDMRGALCDFDALMRTAAVKGQPPTQRLISLYTWLYGLEKENAECKQSVTPSAHTGKLYQKPLPGFD